MESLGKLSPCSDQPEHNAQEPCHSVQAVLEFRLGYPAAKWRNVYKALTVLEFLLKVRRDARCETLNPKQCRYSTPGAPALLCILCAKRAQRALGKLKQRLDQRPSAMRDRSRSACVFLLPQRGSDACVATAQEDLMFRLEDLSRNFDYWGPDGRDHGINVRHRFRFSSFFSVPPLPSGFLYHL